MLLSRILDLIAPPLCLCCGGRLYGGEEFVCASCLATMPYVNHAAERYGDNLMAQHLWGLLPLERCTAWIYYHPKQASSRMIREVKYNGNYELAHYLGRLVASTFVPRGFFEGVDMILPMPITKGRRRQRSFNQSEEICRTMSEVTGIPVATDIVERVFYKKSQTNCSHEERLNNVKGAFRALRTDGLEGKHLLLFDDVFTTGATVEACLAPIKHIPGIRFSVLTMGWTGK